MRVSVQSPQYDFLVPTYKSIYQLQKTAHRHTALGVFSQRHRVQSDLDIDKFLARFYQIANVQIDV